jgi:hypothetical protein
MEPTGAVWRASSVKRMLVRKKAAANAADTQRATLGFLQQHDPNESGGDHQVNDKEDGGHNGVIQKLKI